jgi:hypothetical protein
MTTEYPKRSTQSMGMRSVPVEESIAKKPKTVNLTSINVYPSKYKIVDGEALVKSINIENVEQQKDALRDLNTTILIGDYIMLDFKFGHYTGGQWVDYFVCGVYKVKEIVPNMKTGEILVRVSKV